MQEDLYNERWDVVADCYTNLKDLQTHGYVVIPNFLTERNIAQLTSDYHREIAGMPSELYKKRGIVTSTQWHGLNNLINELLSQIRLQTNIVVDFCHASADYFNNNDVNFGYHQDHEPYWLWQNSYNGLNIWIPLIKSEGDEDGLCVIPANTVSTYHNLLHGKGAQRFIDNNNGSTSVVDDCSGEAHTLNVSFDSLKVVPTLYPGDALVMRADTIHKSQPKTHFRIAASIRCINTQGWVDRSVAYNWVNDVWKHLIKQNDILYTNFFEKLSQEYANNERVQIRDIVLTNN